MATSLTTKFMSSIGVRASKIVYPTGDKNLAVRQGFPSGFSAVEADPFLMCDHFGPMLSTGMSTGDDYPVSWHPHRGFDLLTYIIEGNGRHADSMGNRGTFSSPGIQWISAGSGIEHAEAGGTPAGENMTGFQIWVNVPSSKKMDDPRYGTHGPESIPQVSLAPGVSVRVLAGPIPDLSSRRGPFATVQSVSIMDLSIAAGAVLDELSVPIEHDNVLLYCYRGSGVVSGVDVPFGHTIRLDASNPTVRAFSAQSGEQGMGLMLFSGTRLNQRIAWHGPIVMTTQNELEQAFRELRSGTFLKYRAPFDYRVASQAPSDWNWDSPNPIHMNR